MDSEEPDLRVAGLSLWAPGGGSAGDAGDDYWDDNWLYVKVQVEAHGAFVEAQGNFVHASELEDFLNELIRLDRTVAGTATLDCMEGNLAITIDGDSLGRATAKISITPYTESQSHQFIFSIDQSHFKHMIAGCKKILAAHPIRGFAWL